MIMKLFSRLTLVAIVLVFFACESINAQANPIVSSAYSLKQIDLMHQEHRMDRPRDTHPTEEMRLKFLSDFPKAKDVKWEKSAKLYEVEFEIGRYDYDAYYDMQANLIMYKCELNESQLPAVVRNAALAKYPNYRFEDVDKVVKGKDTFYKVELEKGKMDVKITLKEDGTIVEEYID